MYKIIGISGKAGHGKDASAKILKEKLEKLGKKTIIIHNADYLKFICKEYFGWNGKKTKAGRSLLQSIGTDKVRSKYPDFWIHAVTCFIVAFESDYDYFIIADCRFPNEYGYLKKCDLPIVSVRVNRIGFENSLTPEQRSHSSEVSLDNYQFDHVLDVAEGIENLEENIAKLIDKIID